MLEKNAFEEVPELDLHFYILSDGRLETCDRPLSLEQVYTTDEVQDENHDLTYGSSQEWRLFYLSRPQGRLFPNTCPSGVQIVSPVCLGQNLAIESPVLWIINCITYSQESSRRYRHGHTCVEFVCRDI